MEKAEYVIVNSDGEYFVKITKINTIMFTKRIGEATKLSYDEAQELVPIIELYSKIICIVEPV